MNMPAPKKSLMPAPLGMVPPPPSFKITYVRNPKGPQVKVFNPLPGGGYDDEIPKLTWYEHGVVIGEGIDDLFQRIRDWPFDCAAIHAKYREGTQTADGLVRRAYLGKMFDDGTGDDGFFDDQLSNFLTLDFDDTPMPPGHGYDNVPAAIDAWHEDFVTRNPMFKGVGMVVKLSGSAGITGTGKLKIHATFLLSNGVYTHDRNTIFNMVNEKVDDAVGRSVQPHFWGGRICNDFDDPLGDQPRTFLFEGRPFNSTPTIPEAANPLSIQFKLTNQTTEFGRKQLNEAADRMRNSPKGKRYTTTWTAAMSIGGYIAGGEIYEADALATLDAAVQGHNKPRLHQKGIRDALERGMDRPLSSATAWGEEILKGKPDPLDVAKILITFDEDERTRFWDGPWLNQNGDDAKRKIIQGHIDKLLGEQQIERAKDSYAQSCLTGEISRYRYVKDNGKGDPVMVNLQTGAHVSRTSWFGMCSLDPEVAVQGANKILWKPATEVYWKDKAQTKYDAQTFEPGQGLDVWHGDRRLLNTYRPAHPGPSQVDPGHAGPYMQLLEVNLPNDIDGQRDADVLLDALAWAVQRPADLIKWAPVLQGAEGCGKGLLIEAPLHHCCGHNVGLTDPNALAGDFNGEMKNKTVMIVAELGERRRAEIGHIVENLKKPLTDELIEVTAKGRDLVMMRNFASWFFMTNYKTSMLTNSGTAGRRYAHLISALQSQADIDAALPVSDWNGDQWAHVRALVTNPRATWFAYYVAWRDQCGGAEAIRAMLEQRVLSHVKGTAPITSSREEAEAEGMLPLAKFIKEMIDDDALGFANGFVYATAVLEAVDNDPGLKRIATGKNIGTAMATLGYTNAGRLYASATDRNWFPKKASDGGCKVAVYTQDPSHKDHDARVLRRLFNAAQSDALREAGINGVMDDNTPPMTDTDRPTKH